MVLKIVSQKCRYALRAIFELALRNTTDPVKIQEIATAQAIPPRFLEIILAELKHGGFVESRRGSDGGYILARPAQYLAVGEVIGFLQGTSSSSGSIKQAKPYLMGDYAFSKLWKDVRVAISDIYNNTTFTDLVEEEWAIRKNYIPNYII